jgi:cytochrome b6-f complex iron-sulfur subunit
MPDMPSMARPDGSQTRRQFLEVTLAGVAAFIAVGCSPSRKKSRTRRSTPTTPTSSTSDASPGAFGGRIRAGTLDGVLASIKTSGAPHYVREARAYVVAFPSERADSARAVYPADVLPLLSAGALVLSQRCTHLGCHVPWCASSAWFECPCHDAKFDQVGEYRRGPAPRGMDLMKASIEDGRLVIDTATILVGMPVGTNTTHQAPAGPFCV